MMKKLSEKIAKRLKKAHSSKIVDLLEYRQSRDALLKEWRQLRDAEGLIAEGYDPQHAVYAAAQNMLSLLIEILSELDELDQHNKIIGEAEEEYMPSWPPVSPVSQSYFFTWCSLDVRVGFNKESYTTCLLDLREILNLSEDICHLFTLMESFRLGVYKVIAKIKGKFLLEELFDQKKYLCVLPSEHSFHAGELWLTRLFPPIHSHFETYTVFTSPYIWIHRKVLGYRFLSETSMQLNRHLHLRKPISVS